MAPCGAIISNIEDMSHWLIALMNDGKYDGKQVLPAERAEGHTAAGHRPAQHLGGNSRLLGDAECGLRDGAGNRFLPRPPADFSRRRLRRLPHPGFVHAAASTSACIVFVIGDHCARALQHRQLQRLRATAGHGPDALERAPPGDPAEGQEGGDGGARQSGRRTAFRIPSLPTPWRITSGEYENPAYGVMKIGLKDDQLQFDFHKIRCP